jgi:hypothetical protein
VPGAGCRRCLSCRAAPAVRAGHGLSGEQQLCAARRRRGWRRRGRGCARVHARALHSGELRRRATVLRGRRWWWRRCCPGLRRGERYRHVSGQRAPGVRHRRRLRERRRHGVPHGSERHGRAVVSRAAGAAARCRRRCRRLKPPALPALSTSALHQSGWREACASRQRVLHRRTARHAFEPALQVGVPRHGHTAERAVPDDAAQDQIRERKRRAEQVRALAQPRVARAPKATAGRRFVLRPVPHGDVGAYVTRSLTTNV